MRNITKKSLVQLVLSSTLFMVAPFAFGALIISTPIAVPPPLSTTTTGDITITSTGSLTGTGNAIVGNNGDVKVTIDSNNIYPFALHTELDPIRVDVGIGIGIISLTVGENSTIKGDLRAMAFNNGGLDLLNNGTITGESAIALAGNSILVNIINTPTGLIEATGSGSAIVLNTVMLGGNIINQGVITSATDPAISVRFLESMNNSGTIFTTNADAIIINDGAGTITNGIVNSGTITAGGANNAINVGATTNNIAVTNNAPGIVNGNIIVSSNAAPGTVLTMNGGTINGSVIELVAAGARTFEVNGGIITGGIDISAGAGADTINQSGGTIGNIIGNPLSVTQQLVILGPVTTGGTITDLASINVQDSFTINHDITNVGQLLISPNGLAINNSSIVASNVAISPGGIFQANPTGIMFVSGPLTNNGTLVLKVPVPSTQVNVVTDTYTQTSSAILEVEIKDKQNFGRMNITGPGVTDISNRGLKIDVTGTGLIYNLDTFKVVDNVGAGTLLGSFILLQPNLATIKFTDVSTSTDVILEAIRTPFSDLTTSDITTPPAVVVDQILNSGVPLSPEFTKFIIGLDSLSVAGIDTAFKTVVPQFDGGLVQLSHTIQKNIFQGIGQYIDEHRPLTSFIPCYVAGDVGMGRDDGFTYSRGNWAKGFASRATQQAESPSDGYDLDNIGFIVGYDQYCSDRVLLGGALSYSTGEIRSKGSASRQDVTSFQVTGYSTYDYKGPGYLDVMGAVSFNEYNSTRNIIAGSFFSTALGQFNSWQYGINLESGYRFSYGKYRIIPVARLLYSYLQIDNYTETGAGGLSLSVLNNKIEEGVTGIGVKFNSTNHYQEATYVPEFRFNIFYDWIADGQVMTSNFLEGGSPFITNAIKPHACTYNIGLSFTALAQSSLVLVLNYDLDLKQGYVDNSVSMKFRYEW